MELQSQDARHDTFGFVLVGDFGHQLTIDKVLQFVAAGDDRVIIPILFFDLGTEFLGIADLFSDILFVLLFVAGSLTSVTFSPRRARMPRLFLRS